MEKTLNYTTNTLIILLCSCAVFFYIGPILANILLPLIGKNFAEKIVTVSAVSYLLIIPLSFILWLLAYIRDKEFG